MNYIQIIFAQVNFETAKARITELLNVTNPNTITAKLNFEAARSILNSLLPNPIQHPPPDIGNLNVTVVVACEKGFTCSSVNIVPGEFTVHVLAFINNTEYSFSNFIRSETGKIVAFKPGDQGIQYQVKEDRISAPSWTYTYSPDCSGTIRKGEYKSCIVTSISQSVDIVRPPNPGGVVITAGR